MSPIPAKLKQFCEKAEIARLAFIDGKGYPHVIPVWFVRAGNAFVFGTEATSIKWRLIQKNPHVGWVIDGGTSVKNYKGVSFWGTAELITDRRLRRRAYRALGEKYFGSAESRAFRQIYGELDEPGTVFIRLRPERFFFWDYSG